jgi:hypothetical protein
VLLLVGRYYATLRSFALGKTKFFAIVTREYPKAKPRQHLFMFCGFTKNIYLVRVLPWSEGHGRTPNSSPGDSVLLTQENGNGKNHSQSGS